MTRFGKGGWHVGRYGIGYTDPITGNAFHTDWRGVRRVPKMRREVNSRERTPSRGPSANWLTWWW